MIALSLKKRLNLTSEGKKGNLKKKIETKFFDRYFS
jgi:hypothetical protein